MKGKTLASIQSLRHLCPFLRQQTHVTEELIAKSASQCPFMKAAHLVEPGQSNSLEAIAKRLNDPWNFIDMDSMHHPKGKLDYESHFTNAIQKLKDESRYRVFINILRQCGDFPRAQQMQPGGGVRDVVVWCSNDYLGMGQHPSVLRAMTEALQKHGAASGGTRNIGGTTDFHVRLEAELADLHGKKAALVCTSGYVANEAALSTLPKVFPQGLIYFSDAENHASMIEGMRHSRISKNDIRVFKHNDLQQLEQLLQTAIEAEPQKARVVVFESVYSMSGTVAPLASLKALARKYHCMTYIDEVHGVGLYGQRGGGLTQELGVEMDIISGTLGKAFGVHGGYIAASGPIIDCIRSYSSDFIFTTSIPHVVAAGAIASIQHLKRSSDERNKQREHVRYMKRRLAEENLPLLPSDSHIIPLFIGNPERCKHVSDTLLTEFGIYVQPINYPTVPKGKELLRLSPGPLHTPQLIDEFVAAAKTVWTRFGLVTLETMKAQEAKASN
jgi:5-aminolevulinate synthase